jgi:predicted kinase
MRIAISGTQSTGKTTLAGDLAGVLPNTRVEPEPFRVLQNRLGLVSGADSMTPEQELALIRHAGSRLSALRAGETVVFDRCALDALAHAVVAAESGNPAFTVPLEDDLALIDDGVRSTDGAYQAAVDRTIRSLAGDLPNVLEVRGSRTERVRRILLEIDPNGDYATS